MQEQVSIIIKEILPALKQEITNELRAKYEKDLYEALQQATDKLKVQVQDEMEERMQNMQSESFEILQRKTKQVQEMEQQISMNRQRFRENVQQELSLKFVQEFEKEKRIIYEQVSSYMGGSNSMKNLLEQLKNTIALEKEHYYESEFNKQQSLLRLNLNKRNQVEMIQRKEQMIQDFQTKLHEQLSHLSDKRNELLCEFLEEQAKINRIDDEKKFFKQDKVAQEQKYKDIVDDLQNQVMELNKQIQDEKKSYESRFDSKKSTKKTIRGKENIKSQPIRKTEITSNSPPKLSDKQSPFKKSLKNQINIEQNLGQNFQLTYENALNLFDPNELPDILPYEKQENAQEKKVRKSNNQTSQQTIQSEIRQQQRQHKFKKTIDQSYK